MLPRLLSRFLEIPMDLFMYLLVKFEMFFWKYFSAFNMPSLGLVTFLLIQIYKVFHRLWLKTQVCLNETRGNFSEYLEVSGLAANSLMNRENFRPYIHRSAYLAFRRRQRQERNFVNKAETALRNMKSLVEAVSQIYENELVDVSLTLVICYRMWLTKLSVLRLFAANCMLDAQNRRTGLIQKILGHHANLEASNIIIS
ncbi:hypothetical protein AVEN_272572-1 [Araneus ventricosus]|uniref:Uncharacterized protein n=1 Tax=Araneus ventricosus TaxID=182803 RepID=A0A4Y2MXZ0_ARAVE|nr:hypothetical protein AVEN_272572-1 [Araneus ventricosus]